MSKQWQWQRSSLFLIFFLGFELATTNSDYACKFASYPFCDTSLPTPTRARSLVSLLTLPEKILLLSNNASSVPRLGIPAYQWWSESLHGLALNGPGVSFNGTVSSATDFPQVILSAASFNRSLWFRTAAAIAREARAMFNVGQAGLTFWAPNINLFRDPRWGRGQETPGEDPMLASAYAVEFVRGLQGLRGIQDVVDDEDDDDDALMVSACCKHFTAYDLDMWRQFARYNFNAVVSQQDLEDTYQPPFRGCIQQGKASCLMCSYNEINGVPACASEELLGLARDKWGFKGYITSDCDAVATVYEYQKYAKSEEDAVADVLKAGMDINCGTFMLRHTESAVEQGKVKEEDLDRALLNLFSVQLRLGLFDGDPIKGQFGKLGPKDVCTPEHKTLALDATRQGIVLLKNDKKFLPLNRDIGATLAVIGPMAATKKLGGGYSDDLVSSVADASKNPVILVLTGGGPLDISFAKKHQEIASILWVGYPGEAGGRALAEIIFGEFNPAGRLPMTWYPEAFTNVPMNDMSMRADPSRGYPGRTYRFYTGSRVYGFGHGLSYSDFSYNFLSAPSKISLSRIIKDGSRKRLLYQAEKEVYGVDYVPVNELQNCNSLSFSVHISVMNLGDLDGSHVIMLFSRGPKVVKGSPETQLVGFSRLHTISNKSTETSILVYPCEHLSFADEQGKRILPLGPHTLSVGNVEHIVSIEIY
ncbi:beta-D-xylosidase 7 [Spatholobus suberectus]|nr:beta-D-xylosidase 7 [Spatholobus suberectus]